MDKSRIKKEEGDSLLIDIKEESDSEASVIVDFCPQDVQYTFDLRLNLE